MVNQNSLQAFEVTKPLIPSRKMKTNVHPNSREVYHSDVKSLSLKQNSRVMSALGGLWLATGKMISKLTGIPPGEISRCLRQLEKDGLIHFVKDDKCKISNKKAAYWAITIKQLTIF